MNQSEILTSEKVEEMKKENLQLRIKATTEATRSEVAALFNHQGLELTEEVLNVIAADTTQKILANARAIIDMLAVKKVDTEDNTAFAKKIAKYR